ncbi:leucine-rich repeat-containing protein 71-like isoform X2 [Gigantopelta aegis]|uniref:leucine-rich repeat-containing protein 71-like isoform X2 n=1 Tax=Gigantopelta aegis TaxID=1735272 RepID=UPI001B88B4B1|nr:leucine-rich repeat-containing protein 71-like isoform X2 [Gigantopelta aegis]
MDARKPVKFPEPSDGHSSKATKGGNKKNGIKDGNHDGIANRVRMGKKVEKGQNKDKNLSSANTDTVDDEEDRSPEPYGCTGNFQSDFTELCRRDNMTIIPPVVLRARPPSSTQHVQETKQERGKEKGKQPTQAEPDVEPELTEDGEPVEPPPKTYVVKDSFEFFKPTVQVELEHPDKYDTVSELFVRGWRIDESMMNIFRQCLPVLEKLHTINLWHTGLSGETISILAGFLPQCLNIRNLILDGNWLKEENWHELIGEESLVQNMSLRNCLITDKGAEGIGQALGTPKKVNTKLLSLNLAGNRITDTGCEHIARGLRMNRTLLSLSLASNQIGDKGTSKMAETLSRFPLTHEEVVERRRQISDKGSPDRNKSPSPTRRADSQNRPGSVRSGVHMDKTKRDKPSAKQKKDNKGKDVKEEDKKGGTRKDDKGGTKKASIATDAGKSIGKSKDRKRDKKPTPQETEMPDVPEVINPLLEVADLIGDQLWVAGNRVLINLNLSRNHISAVGVQAMLKAMQYQTSLTLDNRNSGTGLMRLNLNVCSL